MITFGEYIRKTRDERDYSLREMAELIGCSPAFLSDIELGKRYPSEKILEKIAQVLKIKKTELEKYDMRSTVNVIKKAATIDPTYAIAFRQIIDKKLPSEELLKIIKRIDKEGK